ncbi:MAG TPA: hypothetical protein VK826_20425 [Bacteroidia bacterium]|nr:hypothetical protein [Bacteroidia bacterium]
MKKLIFPALLSILLLTSCSQALYKSKYDWVKVDPAPKQMKNDSLRDPPRRTKSAPARPVEIAKSAITEFIETVKDTTTPAPGSHPDAPAVIGVSEKKSAPDKISDEEETVGNAVTGKGSAAPNQESGVGQHAGSDHKHAARKTTSDLTGEEWGYIGAGAGVLVLLLLMAIFGAAPVIAAIVIIVEIFLAVMSIVAIGLMIYGIFWFFGHFIFMFDN